MIEKLPFFESYFDQGKAIVNVALLEQWIRENPLFDLMTEQDELDRNEGYEELSSDRAVDLKKAMESW